MMMIAMMAQSVLRSDAARPLFVSSDRGTESGRGLAAFGLTREPTIPRRGVGRITVLTENPSRHQGREGFILVVPPCFSQSPCAQAYTRAALPASKGRDLEQCCCSPPLMAGGD